MQRAVRLTMEARKVKSFLSGELAWWGYRLYAKIGGRVGGGFDGLYARHGQSYERYLPTLSSSHLRTVLTSPARLHR